MSPNVDIETSVYQKCRNMGRTGACGKTTPRCVNEGKCKFPKLDSAVQGMIACGQDPLSLLTFSNVGGRHVSTQYFFNESTGRYERRVKFPYAPFNASRPQTELKWCECFENVVKEEKRRLGYVATNLNMRKYPDTTSIITVCEILAFDIVNCGGE